MRILLRLSAVAIVLCLVLSGLPASAQTPSIPGAKVFFVNIKNGDTVKSPFKVEFGLTGMKVTHAGDQAAGTGHHHLLIDTVLEGDALFHPIDRDETHLHFGGGETETMLTLAPGKHTLQLVLSDWKHYAFGPPVISAPITITVQ